MKRRPPTAFLAGLAVLTVVVLVAGIAVVARRPAVHHDASALRAAPPTTAPPVMAPSVPGTTVLTEPVDPAQIAVPQGWQSISTDSRTLPDALRALERGHPSLTGLLRIEQAAAREGGVRLFAFTNTRPMTFVSVKSFASPGFAPIDERAMAAYPHQVKRSRGTVLETLALRLPAGGAVQTTTVISTKTFHAAARYDLVVLPGRTIEIHLVTEDSAVPPVFAQIENSLRAG